MSPSSRIVTQLICVQVTFSALAMSFVVFLVPRVLLVDAAAVNPSLVFLMGLFASKSAITAAYTVLSFYPFRPKLNAVMFGGTLLDPIDIDMIYMLPPKSLVVDLVAAFAVCSIFLADPLRPEHNELYLQMEISELALTFSGAALLPAYNVMRHILGRVLETLPLDVTQGSVLVYEQMNPTGSRMRTRFLAAVALPVAFVALGASLVVTSAVRATDAQLEEDSARLVASAALGSIQRDDNAWSDGDLSAARAALLSMGVRVEPQSKAEVGVVHGGDGITTLQTFVRDGARSYSMRFATSRPTSVHAFYAGTCFFVIGIAVALSSRFGRAVCQDLLLGAAEVRALYSGEHDPNVRRHSRARFDAVRDLLESINDLGAVFRRFASVQRAAIFERTSVERVRALFLASMSHDLKGPLNAILGFSELVKREDLSSGQRESIDIIEQRGKELLHLIQTILDSARIEANELSVSPEMCVSEDIVMSAVLDARELCAGAGTVVSAEVQRNMPRMRVDSARIVQAIVQVILAVAQFATQGGTVFVRSVAREGYVSVEVESQRDALSQKDLERVFEAFRTPELARRHGSLGLGLSLAKTLLELHRGSIEVETIDNGGTLFRIWIPAERRTLSSRPPPGLR